ncbi:response regulator transcription factor [Paraliobacillus sediminis]|uniref:response regulator transcription factor n=1 Tax=Paraliobacillus sediminis TaxID=1885916 RepID=UPI000E3E04D8|nr:response regulator transcription factor [Paraliobacillus sediminis]
MNKKYTVLIAEDQLLFREMIINIFDEMDEFLVIASVDNGEEAIEFINRKEVFPDLCLLDIQTQKMTGVIYAERLKDLFPKMKVVLLTDLAGESFIEKALSVGIDGYVLKESSLDQFKQMLRFIIEGQFIAPQHLIHHFSERLITLQGIEQDGSMFAIKELFKEEKDLDLNDRDYRLIQFVNKGWTNQMIANELSIKEGTVKNYISGMYKKLHIRSRRELMQILMKTTS